ncbi:MAG: DUF2190 family protein [Verrucomicrobiota bacterium]|nr:MAG: DUF2190 family protein [Verrucomicrobiota bacterium]
MDTQILSNVALGTHEDCLTKNAQTALTAYRLVKIDPSNGDQVMCAGPNDCAFGVTTDEAQAGEEVNIALLGCSSTLKITTSGAITSGDLLMPGDNGTVRSMPTEEGQYMCIGIALSGAASGGTVEVLTSFPSQCSVTA